jgi:hypothetical protein
MIPPRPRTLCVALLLGASVTAQRRAHAAEGTLSACIEANESSIQLRAAHELLAAREKSLQCAGEGCPEIVRDACRRRVDQVNAAIPTIVFEVKDGAGRDLVAQVTVDAAPIAGAVQGAAIPLDPGEHAFVFEAAGWPPVTRSFILREGEKDRREAVVIGPPATVFGPPAVTPDARQGADGASAWSGQKTAALVAGGGGVAALAVGAVFGLMARASWSSSQSECTSTSHCPRYAQAVSDRDSAASSATVATIAFVAGGAALAAGAVLWLTAPRRGADSTPAAAVVVSPGGPAGAGVTLRGWFF